MVRYRKIFSKKNSLFIVIHVESGTQALRNTEIAKEAGADGAFLINHDIPFTKLLEIYGKVRQQHPDWWIGINCLDLSPLQIIESVPVDTSGIWVDDAGLDEETDDVALVARSNWARRQQRNDWPGLYFGGVAFKYQKHVSDLARIAWHAMEYMDVITTSGEKTGSPPDIEKIRVMRSAIGKFPLAIASGITPENISQYLDMADCFLVATGVSRTFCELDADRVKELVKAIETG